MHSTAAEVKSVLEIFVSLLLDLNNIIQNLVFSLLSSKI